MRHVFTAEVFGRLWITAFHRVTARRTLFDCIVVLPITNLQHDGTRMRAWMDGLCTFKVSFTCNHHCSVAETPALPRFHRHRHTGDRPRCWSKRCIRNSAPVCNTKYAPIERKRQQIGCKNVHFNSKPNPVKLHSILQTMAGSIFRSNFLSRWAVLCLVWGYVCKKDANCPDLKFVSSFTASCAKELNRRLIAVFYCGAVKLCIKHLPGRTRSDNQKSQDMDNPTAGSGSSNCCQSVDCCSARKSLWSLSFWRARVCFLFGMYNED